ncbi:hypothetical protein M5K25_011966 [Dendrobium thyrsiflorum]|uniref:Mediator complex subunit 15 KIX domain-containing protein n=1 Tax=Dendrobium thyrsiflorum TaxID=117978 RepID=A0ABD0VB62_DENTH
MENNNWRPAQGETPSMEVPSSDWRSQLQPEARQRIVNKIMDTLRRHLPVAAPEGMTELKKIAVRFEEKIYAAAVNQSDYLRKISLKMLSMETKTQQNTPMNSQPGVNQNSTDTGSIAIPPQVNSQGQSLPQIPLVGPPSGRQQHLPQNLQNNTPASMQGSSSLSASPSITGLTQSTITNFGHTSNMQNMPGISHSSVNNSLAQGTTTDIYANAQRHMQGRQQQQSQNPLIYQNQLQPQLMKNIHNNALLQPSMHQQQQQQSLLQTNQLQTSQQSTMQMPSGLTSGQSSIQQPPATSIQSASQPALQQNQLNAIQQSVSPLLPQHVHFARQSQQPQSSLHQQTNLQTQQQQQQQQQQQLIGQQANMSNIQQNQLLGQQNSIVDIKQQQQRLPVQANNLINMQQSQQLLNQQSLSLHQQQLGQQTNMQGLQQQQQPQSQQQLIGSLQNISNMQSHQRSMQLLQQSKNMSQTQQQLQQPSISLLQPQGQQSHHMSSQQHLMSQFQSQGPLQQPLAMQQQSNSMQRDIQQRIPSGTLLQPQSAMEQQKQFMQSQRGIPEVSSSTSMDSTAQTGHNGADWQEEIYQKIQAMKEAHLAELQEFHQKISQRYQQSEMMPHAKQSGNFEKLKSFKVLLERVLAFLQISKNSITIGLKEKLPTYEKQIIGLLNTNNKQKIMPLPLQGQQQPHLPGGLAQSTPQHQPSQVPQVQQHENLGNQVHQMNMTGSITSMQSAVTSGMQHGSMTLTSLVAPATQQNATNSVQSAPDLDPVQVNSFGSLQQGTMGSLQQSGVGPLPNSVGASQQTNLNNLSQSSLSSLQPNGTSVQNSNVLQQQHLKTQQKEHLLQNQQQLKQQLQQRQIQQQMLQHQQRQQLQQPLQQQVHLQQKQQQPSQLPVHQMSQLHPMNELNELKARQGSSINPGIYQQTFTGVQRPNYYPQQLKPGASFPISSPQSLQASSPQISHHSSPQIEHALLPTHAKPGTPMQSTGSPFVVPSPSPSTPIAPSPIQGDSEKLLSAAVSLPTTGQTTNQQAASATLQSQSISVATPGISASPLLAEFPSQEGNLTNATSRVGASERPLERLIKAVQSLSPTALSSAVSDISSVVSMIDRIAGSAPGNGSRAAVGEDLVAMTKCRMQARNFMSQDGGTTTKKMKRHTSAMPLNNVSSAGSVNDNFMKFGSLDSSELESTATSHVKRRKLEVNHALQEEIRVINQQLIDTVVSICDEDSDSAAAAAAASSEGVGEGTIIECSFNAVAFSPSLKAHFASMHMCPIAPLRLLVPSNYPKCSPLLVDKIPIEPSKEFEDLSIKAKSRFSISLRGLSQPMSLGEMAGTWDTCARKVIVEYVQQTGGGSFSSTYGAWENCVGA